MPKRKARRPYSMSLVQMQDKLLEWNPHWSRHSVEGFSVKQLVAVYHSEKAKTVKQIRLSLGLN